MGCLTGDVPRRTRNRYQIAARGQRRRRGPLRRVPGGLTVGCCVGSRLLRAATWPRFGRSAPPISAGPTPPSPAGTPRIEESRVESNPFATNQNERKITRGLPNTWPRR